MPTKTHITTPFTEQAGIDIPLICGAMYPCSNPELVGAASAAGAIGIVQPISLTYVHGHDLREGLRLTSELAGGKPIGFNALIEASSKIYLDRMRSWVDVALEEGVRFFVTALGKPGWVVEKVHAAGGVVYHDVTERKWADKALDEGVDGLICVNAAAGGHAGTRPATELVADLADLGVPLVCAGGIGSPAQFADALSMGYAACQLGTRFIATTECTAHEDYKRAILDAVADDVVLTDRISGVDVAVIKTPRLEKAGLRAGPVMRWMLRHRRFKHWARLYYSLRSLRRLKKSSTSGGYKDFWQAGKSVGGIDEVLPVATIVERFAAAAAGYDAGTTATRATSTEPTTEP